MKKLLLRLFLLGLIVLMSSCGTVENEKPFPNGPNIKDEITFTEPESEKNEEIIETPTEVEVETDYKITYVSGSKDCYKVEGTTIYFNNISSDTIYSISGSLDGNIVINVSNNYKFELELVGFTLASNSVNPITVLGGKEVQISAKKKTENFIYDYREKVTDENLYSAAIYSEVDLDIAGKGKLSVYSENNNGIHTKDDLQVKNLTLNVVCLNNALKGNDGVSIENAVANLVAKAGDGIKTTNSHISNKNNQKGTISILDSTVEIYAACDGIAASYDVEISGDNTNLSIYTDKYSGYSDVLTDVKDEFYYIRSSSSSYKYSIKYVNSSTEEFQWEDSTYDKQANRYYYHKITKPVGFDKIILYVYSNNQTQGQETNYYKSYNLSVNNNYDTIAISSRGTCDWTNYSSNQGGFGGMQEGNSDKGDYSTKGIKADNQITITSGKVKINAYDDCMHASNDNTLENGKTPVGKIYITGGSLELYSNDDAIHADGLLEITGGFICITSCYEGIEANEVIISGGEIGMISKDDGINAAATSGTSITLSGGKIYIYANGDGIDSNSKASYAGISFSGADVVVISNSGFNSAIDSEKGYSYTSGKVLAIMPSGGMSNETTNCSNFTSIGTKKTNISLSNGTYVTASSNTLVSVKMSTAISNAIVVYLGSNSASINTSTTTDYTYDVFGVYWK